MIKINKPNLLRYMTECQKEYINKALEKGNSIEIHPAKDGIKIYEIKKNLIQKEHGNGCA